MTVVDEQEIARYVEQVRAALADLPPTVRDELTEDLVEHLTEVAAEADGALTERLGPPEAYAAELRSAAGAGTPGQTPNLDQRVATAVLRARARLRAVDARLGPVIGYASASEFLRLLRPAWWLLRGYLAAMLISVMFGGVPVGLLPRLGGSALAALLLLGVCVVTSVWLGRRTPRLRRWPRRLVGASGAVLAVFAVVGFFEADQDVVDGGYGYYAEPVAHERYVRDVYVYDSEGRLVTGARLFDQDGTPIRLGVPDCPERTGLAGPMDPEPDPVPVVPAYPHCPERAPFRFGPAPALPSASLTPSSV
ncbi:HAAS signaling domain-containing protein, partial [Micromonospora echinofusca]